MGTVYVALMLPFEDGSGDVEVLGVYSEYALAAACLWEASKDGLYNRPSQVIEKHVDQQEAF